jgi:hypothetical protein
MIFFSERQLRTAVSDYVEHYHRERNHQGVANWLIEATVDGANGTGKLVRESRLGGLLNHYRGGLACSDRYEEQEVSIEAALKSNCLSELGHHGDTGLIGECTHFFHCFRHGGE